MAKHPYYDMTEKDKPEWQQKVEDALTAQTLNWELVSQPEDTWRIAGECPECHHHMSWDVRWKPIIIDRDEGKGEVEVRCTCDNEGKWEHDDGCGWGVWKKILLKHP